MNTTDLYRTRIAALARETASIRDVYTTEELAEGLAAGHAADAAVAAYYKAVGIKRAEWDAIPDGAAKWSAEENANDTEGCDIDHLRWLEIATMTYSLNGERA